MNSVDKKGNSLNFLWVMALVIAILSIVFTIQNYEKQSIEFLWLRIEDVPLALIIFSCLALGAIITLLFSIPGSWRNKKDKEILMDELKAVRKELDSLKKIRKPNSDENDRSFG